MELTKQQKDLLEFYELKAEVLALDSKRPLGLCKNYYINEILDELDLHTTKNEKTYKQYLNTYKRLLKNNNIEKNEVNLLLHKAKTIACYDLYKASLKFGLISEIKELQKKSDEARKQNNYELMKKLTDDAFKLAVVFKEQFYINIQKPKLNKNNSKKKTLKKLENIEKIINELSEKQKNKYTEQLLVYSLFGLRPAEFKNGIELKAIKDIDKKYYIEATICGAKVNDYAGQELRTCKVSIDFESDLYKQFFIKIVRSNFSGKKYEIKQSEKDYNSLTKIFYRKYKSDVSLYSFRHKVASDLKKAKVDDDTIAKFLGHRTDKSQVSYGSHQQGSSNKSFSATATHEIKHTKNRDFTYIYNKNRILDNNKTFRPY